MMCKATTVQGKACQNKSFNKTDYCRNHQPDAALRPSTGIPFEEKVVKTLEVLGYTVQHNVLINNCQIDLVAKKKTGVITQHLMVECKDYGKDNVSVDDIKIFHGALTAARNKGIMFQGLFVTAHGFTAQARGFAESVGIECTTYEELSTQLVDFDHYIDRVIEEFTDLPASGCYVALSGTESEDYGERPDAIFYRPIENHINKSLETLGLSKLALLGNFGTGKSTFCRKYAHDLAQQYKENRTGRIPVIISLKDYDSKIFIHELILNILQNRYGVPITKSIFYVLQRQGKFIFLFDGFDEMDTRASHETISANLRELDKISDIKENKFILTCRTHFFRNKVHVEILENFGMLYIPEWGETELKEFLQKKFADKWETYLERISGTHNLPELAQTPLFLEMIAETLPSLGDHVKRLELYKKYTDKWIKNQTKRKGAVLSEDERRIFVKELALKLYNENRLSCHYRELPNILKMYLERIASENCNRFALEDTAQIDCLMNDVQTCTFLVRNANGDYTFKHTSFMEFFVAQALSEELMQGNVSSLEHTIIPVTIRGFLVDFLQDNSPVEVLVNASKTHDGEILKDNVGMLTSLLKIVVAADGATETEEQKLSKAFVRGDTWAFDEVYKQHYSLLMNICMSYTGEDVAASEDIVSEVFMQFFLKRSYIETIMDLKKLLYIRARNKCYDYQTAKKRRQIDFTDIRLSINDTEDFDRKQDSITLSQAILLLPENHKLVMQLNIDGFTESEIAVKLGLSLKEVLIIHRKAIEKLKQLMKRRKE
jgi:RNA polymerase sigma factor (sigma-70 family)